MDSLIRKENGTVIEGINFYTTPRTSKAITYTPQTFKAYIKLGKIKSHRMVGQYH